MIARCVRAMRCELLKLRRRPLGWSPVFAAALAAAASVGWRAVSLRAAAEQGADTLRVLPTAWWALPGALAWGVTAGGVLLLIVAAMTLAEERELGTAKVVFSKPIRRGEIVFAKGMVLLLATIAVVLVALAVGLALGGALWGFGDVVDAAYPDYVFHTAGRAVCEIDGVAYCLARQVALAAALTVPPVFALLALALWVGSLTRQTGVSVGIAFALLLLGQAAAWLSDAAAPWIVHSYVRFPSDTLTAYVTGESTRLWAERWPGGPPRLALGLIVSSVTALFGWIAAGLTVSVRPVLSWLLAVTLVGAGLTRGQAAEIRFSIHDLRAPGQVWDVRPVDLDGDGARDLVAFVVRDGFGPNPRRFLALFHQREGRFPLEPDELVEVPPQAVARAVADWDPSRRGAEIGWLTPDGVELWLRGPKGYGSERRMLVRDRGFFDMSSGNQLPSFRDLVADVDGDGRLDVLFPRKREAALWLGGEDSFRLVGRMPVRFRQSYGNRAKQILLGRFLDVDARGGRAVLAYVNRDRRLDVVTIHERRIACWLQKPGGRFGIDPDQEVRLDLLPVEGKRDALERVEVEIVDVDRDGWADCVVYRNTGKVGVFSSLRTQLLYFPGGPRGWRTDRPRQIVNLNGVSIDPVLLDVDHDGRRDLVLSSLRTDLITNVKRALFKSVKVTYYVYRFDRARRSFEPSPGFRRDIDVDVERIEGGGTVPLAYFWGDYDGDGIQDMLTLATDDEVTIYPGRMRGGGFFSGERRLVYPESEKTVLRLETSNSLWIEDLNGDGRQDLVFHYWADDYKRTERGKITVVLTR